MRISGHTLIGEGAPHDSDGRRINIHHPMWVTPRTGPRLGCGMCTCGALGPWTESANARKRWHAEHKADVAKGAAVVR